MRRQAALELAVAVRGLLVHEHLGCPYGSSGSSWTTASQRRPGRRALEAELRHEAGLVVAVGRVVALVPDVPDVHGAVRGSFGCRYSPKLYGDAGRVGPGRIELGDDRRQQVAVVAVAPGPVAEHRWPAPVLVAPDVLVVAVPDHQAGCERQPGHCLARLRLDLVAQRLLLGVGRAGEQEVLPDEQTQLVGERVEVVGLVDAAAPDADQVDVRLQCVAEPASVAVAVYLGEERVVGNPVHAAHEDQLVVDEELERTSGRVGSRVHPYGAEADASRPPGGAER